MRLLDAVELHRGLPVTAAIDALETGFRNEDPSGAPLRSHLETPAGTLLQMPAFGDAGVGVKLVTLTPDNPERGLPFVNAVYVLFDADSQTPDAIVDGAALTALRTAAVSGLVTRHLANTAARRLVIFGAGVQARSHLAAMLAVRSIDHVTVVSRTPGRAEALVEVARGLGVDAAIGGPNDVAHADIVCTCTTSDVSLFDGGLLAPGAHVNAVGSYQPTARELDTVAMSRARVVVETREAALAEAGELCIPIRDGAFGPDHVVADLAQVVRGAEVRTSADDITVFKSVGLAFEDLIVARAAVDAAKDTAEDTG
jgi:ornithine cyclodeaminase